MKPRRLGSLAPAVMCTLVTVVGSAPQEPGARLWAGTDRFFGTLGGGEFERRVLGEARAMIARGQAKPVLKEYVLCKEMGQCCGGRAQVFFEPVPRRKTVHLFGGGHVGRACAQVLSQMPFDAWLVDSRPEWAAADALPSDVRARCEDPLEYAKGRRWTEDDAVCILTHSHELDFELSRFFLGQPLAYLGLIGSEHKAKVFRARLESLPRGATLARLWNEKMHCPIGEKRMSKNPKVIGVAIADEILALWDLR
jgi:xanthine dehydrogenase accessory factor